MALLKLPTVDAASCSHVGMVRESNQDSALAVMFGGGPGSREAHAALMVCDGMGGRKGGEVASALVAAIVRDSLAAWRPDFDAQGRGWQHRATDFLHALIDHANAEVRKAAADAPEELKGMGTTLALAVVLRDWCGVVTVGDSRVYRVRAGLLQQLSIDHSWAEEMRASGAASEREIRESPYAVQLMRVIGHRDDVLPDVRWSQSLPGDLILVCSDGLTKHLGGEMLQYMMRREHDVRKLAENLVVEANARGGEDNIGLVVARTPAAFALHLADPDAGQMRMMLRPTAQRMRVVRGELWGLGVGLTIAMGVLIWALGAYLEWWWPG